MQKNHEKEKEDKEIKIFKLQLEFNEENKKKNE